MVEHSRGQQPTATRSVQEADQCVEGAQRERRAPHLGLLVDERVGSEEEEDRTETDQHDERTREPGFDQSDFGGPPNHAPDPPAEETHKRQGHQKGEQERGSGQPAVEAVREDQHGKPQKRGDRSVVHVGPATGADTLDRQRAGRHAPGAVEQGPGLDVVEVRERDRLEEPEGAARHQPGKGNTGDTDSHARTPDEPAPRRGNAPGIVPVRCWPRRH